MALFWTRSRFAALGVFALLAVSSPLFAEDDDLFWHNNYKEALAEARKTGKPIFLEYRCEP
jgi:hypothetical protein